MRSDVCKQSKSPDSSVLLGVWDRVCYFASYPLNMPSALLGPGCFAGQAFGSAGRCPLASSRAAVFAGQHRVHSAQHGVAEQSRRHAQLQARPLLVESLLCVCWETVGVTFQQGVVQHVGAVANTYEIAFSPHTSGGVARWCAATTRGQRWRPRSPSGRRRRCQRSLGATSALSGRCGC